MLNLGVLINRANLGDPQRNPRVLTLVNDLIQGQGRTQQGSQGSGHSLPWAHAIGSYRFFNNSEISLPSVYAIAHNALRELVPTQTRAYLAHDFSVVDYSKHAAKEDRIQVGNEFGLGYDLVRTGAWVTEKSTSLGNRSRGIRYHDTASLYHSFLLRFLSLFSLFLFSPPLFSLSGAPRNI